MLVGFRFYFEALGFLNMLLNIEKEISTLKEVYSNKLMDIKMMFLACVSTATHS